MLNFKKYLGLTLPELMVALTISMMLFSVLLTIFLANLYHYRKVINTNHLNQQLQSAMDVMVADIRRAGYWANAKNDLGAAANTNPFQASGVDIAVNAGNNCILFAYDRDDDGTLPAINAAIDDERYGYRLVNNTIQTRPPGATFSCTAPNANWENLTDPNIVQITNLTFTLTTQTLTTGPGSKGIYLRSVAISLTGALTQDSAVTRTITQYVRIRNDKFFP